MNGLQMVAGGLGAMSATVPEDYPGIHRLAWSILILSGLTLFSALVLWLVYLKRGSAGQFQ